MKDKRKVIDVVAVYCDNCEKIFFDVFREEILRDSKFTFAFICPYCGTLLRIKQLYYSKKELRKLLKEV